MRHNYELINNFKKKSQSKSSSCKTPNLTIHGTRNDKNQLRNISPDGCPTQMDNSKESKDSNNNFDRFKLANSFFCFNNYISHHNSQYPYSLKRLPTSMNKYSYTAAHNSPQ